MSRTFKAGVLLAALVGLYQVSARASGGGMAPPPSAGPSSMGRSMTPEEMAVGAYNSGIDHRDKGNKLEQKALTDKESDRQKDSNKAQNEYQKALKDFKHAADLSPKMYQAYNGMGFSYRKTGDYAKALEMYDLALQMAPGFPDAIEYRGEAYLALNRTDDAKQSYLDLFASDRTQADILMKAMTEWVARRHAEPAGVDPAALSAFETWMKERAALGAQTVQMALNQQRSWR